MATGHFLALWPLVDPGWPLHDLWPQQCSTLWSGVLPIKFGCHRAFLSNLTSVDPSWPLHDLWPSNALCSGQGFFLPNLLAIGHSWAIWPLVDPDWPFITFDPSNVLRSGQGFFLPNLVGIGHSWAIWPLVDPSWPLHNLWPHKCITLWSGVLPTTFGTRRAFLSQLTSGWPLTFDEVTSKSWPYPSGVCPLPPYQVSARCVIALRNA